MSIVEYGYCNPDVAALVSGMLWTIGRMTDQSGNPTKKSGKYNRNAVIQQFLMKYKIIEIEPEKLGCITVRLKPKPLDDDTK